MDRWKDGSLKKAMSRLLAAAMVAGYLTLSNSVFAGCRLPMVLARDCSDELLRVYARPSLLVSSQRDQLRGFRVILIPGLFSSVFRRLPLVPDYFADYRRWLGSAGIEHEQLVVRSQAAPRRNRARIHRAVRRASKPVILIGHSYGGLYALSTLLHHPELADKVAGFISIQAPVGGAGLAQVIKDHPALSPVAGAGMRLLGGSAMGLASLSIDHRGAHIKKWWWALQELSCRIPMLFVATRSSTSPVQHLFGLVGFSSDGVVGTERQYLKLRCGRYAIVPGWSHLDTVMRTPWNGSLRREDLLQSMLFQSLQIPRKKASKARTA